MNQPLRTKQQVCPNPAEFSDLAISRSAIAACIYLSRTSTDRDSIEPPRHRDDSRAAPEVRRCARPAGRGAARRCSSPEVQRAYRVARPVPSSAPGAAKAARPLPLFTSASGILSATFSRRGLFRVCFPRRRIR